MSQYILTKIASIVNGQIIGNKTNIIKYLLIDSRGAAYPSETLFIAIKGQRHNGHHFVAELYQLGVRCFMVETLPDRLQEYSDAGFIVVPDSVEALQVLAAYHRRQFQKKVIGITGSNGKTIVKEWIYQAIHTSQHVVRSPKSFNSQVGVPLSLWQLEPQYDLAIIEAGISMPGEMEKLEKMIRPDIGIFTHLGEPHQENFTDLAHKASEKLNLFKNCKKIIYCKDNQTINNLIQSASFEKVEKFTWSRIGSADIRVLSIEKKETYSIIIAGYQNKKLQFDIPFIDEASLENAFHVISFLLVMGYLPEDIKHRLLQLSPVAMRLELKQGVNTCTIINDSYNSDLGSLSIALDFLNQQHQHAGKTVILSDILQSGQQKEKLYAEVARLLTEKNITRLIGIGSDLLSQKALFSGKATFYPSTGDFLAHFRKSDFLNESILLKGSRTFEFERILKALEEKVHETVLEINLNAMVHNLNYFRSRLNPGTRIVAMVKAFSYGSGSFEIANLLQFQRIDYLAVAFADEGVVLREAGISVPIMVMNPEKTSFDQIIEYQMEPEIYNFQVLEQFAQAVENSGKTNYPVHLKIDSGMHRLGFMENDLSRLMDFLLQQENLQVKSIFSHLAGSDEAHFDDFTRSQIALFEKLSHRISQSLPYPVLRHILNSAGIERFPEAQYDMVRLGIGLYGISATDPSLVRQISTLKTVILQIKRIEPGETVGYSRRFKASARTKIGILPIGYADGLRRSLGNGVGKIMVNGKPAPIIGNICMDMCMIDLTEIDANEGDEAIVFGESYPITELAKQMNTIPYEVLTSISRRVKRVYYQE